MVKQNTSHAVMAQRFESLDSLDDFPTPPWATRALCEKLTAAGHDLARMSVWEPACGMGYMARPLAEYFGTIYASDVHPYGYGEVHDFIAPNRPSHSTPGRALEVIITNPPFRLAEQFARIAISRAKVLVALLVRTGFLESTGRHTRLFGPHPPSAVLQLTERVPMVKGRCDPKASTATSYAWVVWLRNSPNEGTRFEWIVPCRSRLECSTDYLD
jgi:hypothetical protein